MAALHGLLEEVMALGVRRSLKEYYLEKVLVAAAVASVPCQLAVPPSLLSDMEIVKTQAGESLGINRKATIKEIDIGLRHRGHNSLAKEVKQVHAGRCAVAHPSQDLHQRVADALQEPIVKQSMQWTSSSSQEGDKKEQQNADDNKKQLKQKSLDTNEVQQSMCRCKADSSTILDDLEDRIELLVVKFFGQQQEELEKLQASELGQTNMKFQEQMKLEQTNFQKQMKEQMTIYKKQLEEAKLEQTKFQEHMKIQGQMKKQLEQDLQQMKLEQTKLHDQMEHMGKHRDEQLKQAKAEQQKLHSQMKKQMEQVTKMKLEPDITMPTLEHKQSMTHGMVLELDKEVNSLVGEMNALKAALQAQSPQLMQHIQQQQHELEQQLKQHMKSKQQMKSCSR